MTSYVSLSGGLDSTAALALAAHDVDREVIAVSFEYGQSHLRELDAAEAVAAFYGTEHKIIPVMSGIMSSPALLDSGTVPDGHYTDQSMTATVVTGRNLLFASYLVALANPGDEVWFGVHAGDHAIYPDCRTEFWLPLADLVSDAYQVTVRTPWLLHDKQHIVIAGTQLGAPFDLSWSCYKGGDTHCGRCGTCVERAEAFSLAMVNDPTTYADTEFWKQVAS